MLQDTWNKTYVDKLHQGGPAGIKKHNLGTSFLVAPINLTANAQVRDNSERVRGGLLGQNEAYIKAMQPPDADDESQGSGSPSKAAGSGRAKFKKSPSQIKIEYLSKLY